MQIPIKAFDNPAHEDDPTQSKSTVVTLTIRTTKDYPPVFNPNTKAISLLGIKQYIKHSGYKRKTIFFRRGKSGVVFSTTECDR